MTYLLTTLTILFFVSILLRKMFSKLCAICLATSATWILGLGYLIFSDSNVETVDAVGIAILMGGSAVGSMYYFSSRTSTALHIFKLPYMVTIFALIYTVLTWQIRTSLVVGVIVLWMVFFVFHLFRNTHLKSWSKKIIECCKNW
jgi:hypothetical protein